MSEDVYKTLGVSREATAEEIQRAYRKMAAKYHPDKNPNDKSAKRKFQELQAAYDVLKDPEKREMYDRYGSSFEQYRSGGPRPGGAGGGFEGADFGDFFSERHGSEAAGNPFDFFFRQAQGAQGPRAAPGRRGRDVRSETKIPFQTAVTGGKIEIVVSNAEGKRVTLGVTIPAGIEDGKELRIGRQGEPGVGGGPPGDLLLTIRIAAHPSFTRNGSDLYVTVPVTLAEAALGGKIDVPTPRGMVTLTVPPGSSGGTKLRVKGHGVPEAKNRPAGHLYAVLQIQTPQNISPEEEEMLRAWDERNPFSPREDLRW
ncbi:MAG: J domain-containing protein [Planctomycetales bacterium]